MYRKPAVNASCALERVQPTIAPTEAARAGRLPAFINKKKKQNCQFLNSNVEYFRGALFHVLFLMFK